MHRDASATAPSDLIELGVVRGAYGLKGWARVAPHARDGEVLRAARRWWLGERESGRKVPVDVSGVRRHGDGLVAKWAGCETPEVADALKGATVAVARSDFPSPGKGEYYWVDLIGARVVNRTGDGLGQVEALRHNGVQDVMVVKAGDEVRLIPMLDAYVDRIDLGAREIVVDWARDW